MRAILVAVIALVALGATTVATAEELVFGDQWRAFYKTLSTEEPKIMPPGWRDTISVPPPPDDPFTRAEVAHIIALKPLRKLYQPAIEKQKTDVVHPFTDSLGLSAAQVEELRAFWTVVVPDITRVHMHFKAKFDRARPRQYSDEVAPSIDPPGHPAYPSGHSTDAHTLALILGDIWPDKSTHLLSIAYQIALNREIAGVHYRSDTSAGFVLALQIYALMKRDPKVSRALDHLKTELTRG